MDYENTLEKKKIKEIKELLKQKAKYKDRSKLSDAAKLANCIGEILSENGCFEDAIQEHKEEIYLSEASNDVIGVAIGHRKVGECFCELGMFEEALEHQQMHLKIAKANNNYLEEQRALATIGRTHFVQAERLSDDCEAMKVNLKKSQDSYLKSLAICSKLTSTVPENEVLNMKARLYLNLGLVFEYQHNYQEAMKFVSKALVISKEHQLQDNIFRCHLTLFGLHLSENDMEKALQSSKSALMIAQKDNDKVNEMESLSQMGLALLKLENFEAAFNAFKKVYLYTKNQKNSVIDPIFGKNLKNSMKFIKLTHQYKDCDKKEKLMHICEQLGDLYAEINLPEKSLEYYQQQLKLAESLNLTGKMLATIYVSIGVTYTDCKNYEKALEFHKKELAVRQGDLGEKSMSYCAIATCLENLKSPFEEIKKCYMKALECAQGSGKHSIEVKVYQDYLETLSSFGMIEDYENAKAKLEYICKENDINECDSQNLDASSSPNFSEGELEMLETSDEDIEEKEVARNATNRKSTYQNKKINKVNERGETPLQCAAINGNFDKVKVLLVQGASANCRDYCGWTPLHEACNHGFLEIAELLIKYNADVNDPGGQHCGKVTPLHDASQNGHIDVVKLLVENGASISMKTKDGETPLDLVRRSIKADKEEFSNSQGTFSKKLKKVEQFLLEISKQQKFNHLDVPLNRNDKLFAELAGSSSSDECGSFNRPAMKKKKLNNKSTWEDTSKEINKSKRKPAILDFVDNLIETFSSDSENSQQKTDIEVLAEKKTSGINSDNVPVINEVRKTDNTAFVHEDDVVIKDFIVNDMPTSKRKRQSKIRYTKGSNDENIEFNDPKVSKKKKSTKALKQKRIDAYTDVDLTDDTSNDSVPPNVVLEDDLGSSPVTINAQVGMQNNTVSTIFRIRLRVNEQMFLVSVPNGNHTTIEWLLNEAKTRYKNFCGVSTKLLLKTRDGALLNPSDIITDVIMNNEELIGEVVGLDLKPALDRYKTACKNNKIKSMKSIEDQLSFDSFTDFRLKSVFLCDESIKSIFSSLNCSMCLSTLDVSDIFIGDQNFNQIAMVLHSLPLLNTLKLRCIGISSNSIQCLAGVISDGVKDEFKMIMKDPPLLHMTSLHLDSNDFDNQNQFKTSMGRIITHCKVLNQLSLKSCQLSGGIFDSQSTFRMALKKSKISELNLSDNKLGGNEYISNIFNSLNHEHIQILNLSGTSVLENGFMLNGVFENLSLLTDGLKELYLNSLPIPVENGINSDLILEKLHICHQNSVSDSLFSLYGNCLMISNLNFLDLSFTRNFDNDLFEKLLLIITTNVRVMLKSLILKCCSITSPLEDSLFRNLHKLDQSRLNHIDLSYNEISQDDKSKLVDAWKMIYDNNVVCDIEQMKCLLSAR